MLSLQQLDVFAKDDTKIILENNFSKTIYFCKWPEDVLNQSKAFLVTIQIIIILQI